MHHLCSECNRRTGKVLDDDGDDDDDNDDDNDDKDQKDSY